MESKRFVFPYFAGEQRQQTDLYLEDYLNQMEKSWLSLSLTYIVNELASNASKANLKRLYFQKNNLDISDSKAYEKGMMGFKEALTSDSKSFFKLAKEQSDSLVEISFQDSKENFHIEISNNSPMRPEELNRIKDKISQAVHFAGLEDLMLQTMDETEGAGFGLASSILMLRKMGMDETVLQFESTDSKTSFQLSIPIHLLSENEQEVIAEAILEEIQVIPQFPEHIHELQRLLNDPESNFQEISAIIKKDPALISDILKSVNAAAFGLNKQVSNVLEAVKYIGFKGLKNLVIGYATKNLLIHKYKLSDFEKVMTHSSEVAFFAYHLAKHFKLKDSQENLYIASILHDIGKILVYAVMKPELSSKIEAFTKQKGMNIAISENLTQGYNHSIIGSKMAEKWNFPQELIQSIKYHHVPFEAKKEYQDLVSIIYLANTIYYYRRNNYRFENINQNLLKKFQIHSQEDWDKLLEKISQSLTDNK